MSKCLFLKNLIRASILPTSLKTTKFGSQSIKASVPIKSSAI